MIKLGRLIITTNKHYVYNHVESKWWCVKWPKLWVGWYISEEEHLDRIISEYLNGKEK